MPIPLFVNGSVITAAQLNVLVSRINALEDVISYPTPMFQAMILDKHDHASPETQRAWRYAVLHNPPNTLLHYKYDWFGVGADRFVTIHINEDATKVKNLTVVEGINAGTIPLAEFNIPAGQVYVVRVTAKLGSSEKFTLHGLFERAF
jgi:hypothetical protein